MDSRSVVSFKLENRYWLKFVLEWNKLTQIFVSTIKRVLGFFLGGGGRTSENLYTKKRTPNVMVCRKVAQIINYISAHSMARVVLMNQLAHLPSYGRTSNAVQKTKAQTIRTETRLKSL